MANRDEERAAELAEAQRESLEAAIEVTEGLPVNEPAQTLANTNLIDADVDPEEFLQGAILATNAISSAQLPEAEQTREARFKAGKLAALEGTADEEPIELYGANHSEPTPRGARRDGALSRPARARGLVR